MCLKRLTNSFRCHLCTESFRRQEWLQNHLQKIHKMHISSTNISQIQSENPSTINELQTNVNSGPMYKCARCEATFSSKKTINQHFWEAHQIVQTNLKNVFHEHQPVNQVHERIMPETSPTFNQSVETMETFTNSNNDTNILHIQNGNPSAFDGLQNNAESVKIYKCAVCGDTFSTQKMINQHFWEAHQIGQTNIENVSHENQPLNQVHEREMPETSPASNQNVEAMEISTNSIIENEENMFHRVSSSFEFQVAQPKYCTTFATIFNFQGCFSDSNII